MTSDRRVAAAAAKRYDVLAGVVFVICLAASVAVILVAWERVASGAAGAASPLGVVWQGVGGALLFQALGCGLFLAIRRKPRVESPPRNR